ncbi:MAG: hypothetical protein KF753_04655 [Caldilineaceae bacterium]|nr:hypothetical protein [Caldilineaceae bacterium]
MTDYARIRYAYYVEKKEYERNRTEVGSQLLDAFRRWMRRNQRYQREKASAVLGAYETGINAGGGERLHKQPSPAAKSTRPSSNWAMYRAESSVRRYVGRGTPKASQNGLRSSTPGL